MRVLLRHLAPRHPPCTLCSLSHDVEKLKFPLYTVTRGSFTALAPIYAEELYALISRSEPQLLFRPIQLLTCQFPASPPRSGFLPVSPIRAWRLPTNSSVSPHSPIPDLSPTASGLSPLASGLSPLASRFRPLASRFRPLASPFRPHGDYGIRTRDLLLAKQALSQLS
jgi:hypothetical protein